MSNRESNFITRDVFKSYRPIIEQGAKVDAEVLYDCIDSHGLEY